MDAPAESRDHAPERALVALACALILAASTRVTLPLLIFAVVVGVLALPMSSLIAWLSRFDPRPPDDGDGDDGTFAIDPDGGEPRYGEVVPFVRAVVEPLPRPIRPAREADDRLSA